MRLLLPIFLLVSGWSTVAQVLATVGSGKITTEEFHRKLDDVRKQAVNPPSPEQFLEDLIRYEVGVQEAEKMKLQSDPVVRERFRQVLYNALLEKQIGKRVEEIKITEPEMRAFYKRSPEVRIAHILIQVKTAARPEERELVRKRGVEILDEIKKSKRPFEELVRLYTDDMQTKDSGGDIGFQSRVTLVPVLYDAALVMKPGEMRGLIETPFGFHIIKLIERRSYDLADKRQVRAALFDERRARLFNEYFEKLKRQYKIEITPGALKAGKR